MSNSKSQSKAELRPKGRRLALYRRKDLALKYIDVWRRSCPDPKCELYHLSPFQLLVSVVLSAQTTDKMVNRCMRDIYDDGFNPETVLKWGEKKLLSKIRSIGLAPTKAKNVNRLARIIKEQHGGQIPDNRDDLEALPGVGRKTANVILGEIFGHPTIAVDTHVFRVAKRLALHYETSPEKAERELLKVFEPQHLPKAHHWLILHGRYTCKAINPLCDTCELRANCPSVNHEIQ